MKRNKSVLLENLIRRIIKEETTAFDIIGKPLGEVFEGMNGIRIIDDKIIAYAKFFEKGDDFDAVNKAKRYLDSEGFDVGSMYMDYPIAFMIKGKTGTSDDGTTMIQTKHGEPRPLIITKYDRLNRENWDVMDGALISNDFRNGDVYAIFFNFPD